MPRIYPHPYIFMDSVPAIEQDVPAKEAAALVASGAFALKPYPVYDKPPPVAPEPQPTGAPEGAPSDSSPED